MTRPTNSRLNRHVNASALVLDGDEVKARLLAERLETGAVVHVDWVRFSCLLRNAEAPSIDTLFPCPLPDLDDVEPTSEQDRFDRGERLADLRRILARIPDADFGPSAQARELAERTCETLGEDFTVATDLRKGHDFYRYRWSIERAGAEVGWVGFLASGEGPRESALNGTMHVNLYGTACTFARHGWRDRLANLVDYMDGTLTRVDLALDFFDGIEGGMKRIKADYENGLMDNRGMRPKCNMVGDWHDGETEGKGRSFYLGSRAAGKQTNVYEKGHQLYGEKDATDWVRAELRYGNKLRVLSTDMLRRPADFFAGASDWHASLLREAEPASKALPEPVKTEEKLAAMTVEAEVARVIRWANSTAGQTLAVFFKHATEDQFLRVVEHRDLPARLRRFNPNEISRAFNGAAAHVLHKGASAGHACQAL